MKITKAVIPAAGLGTRVLPASKAVPKEMLNIVDKPAIQYLVEEAVRSGITDILIIVSRNQSIIEDHFDYNLQLEAVLPRKDGTFDIIRSCLPASVHLSDNATTPRKIKTGKCSLAMKKYSGQRSAPTES